MVGEIENTEGLYDIKKLKVMYEVGYTDSIAYIRNINTYEVRVKRLDERK